MICDSSAFSRKAIEGDSLKRPSVEPFSTVSLFCGCGGLDLGFRGDFDYRGTNFGKLPFTINQAFDFDELAIQTYVKYFPHKASLADLSALPTSQIPAADVLIGGFPCQEFTACGPRGGLKSPRGQLYKVIVNYLREHQPRIAIAENVAALALMEGGKVLETIKSDFEATGYKVQVWTLNAPDYGVPQTRVRLFFVCVRNDVEGFPKLPRRSHATNHPSIKWAIDDLKDITDESVKNQSQYFKANLAKNGNGQGDEKCKPDLPGYTVRANPKSRIQFHYELDRRLTVRECARLQTFPDNFHFPHFATPNIKQIGNAVPPVLAYKVARTIATFLEEIG